MNALTLFTTCKPFEGEAGVHQRVAMDSWTRLGGACEVIVIGDELGVADLCQSLGFRQIRDVKRNEWGTPYLDSVFEAAEAASDGRILCYLNADILLTPELLGALEQVAHAFSRFLAVGRRWNVAAELFNSFASADREVAGRAQQHGWLEPLHGGVDLFAFPRGLWQGSLPPFLIGRGRWDSGIILAARRMRLPVVDITAAATSVHPIHGYKRPERVGDGALRSEEMRYNTELLGGAECIFSSINATHELDKRGIRRFRPRHPVHMARRVMTASALYPALRPLAPIVRALAARARGLQPAVEAADRPWKFEQASAGD